MKSNPVVHFEMGYEDKKRMCTFYEDVFGWQTQILGPDMGDYVLATTAETDTKTSRPKLPGSINGGFYQKTENPLSQAPSIVVAVDDIHAAMKSVAANGGKILGGMDSSGKHSDDPTDIPGIGLWISVMDTEGNRLSMLQSQEM